MRLIIFGAGGHGGVVADVAVHAGWEVAGFLDDDLASCAASLQSFPLLGDRVWLGNLPRDTYSVALGIGDNYARAAVAELLNARKILVPTLISPFAFISPSARIGAGTVIMPGVVVNARAVVGEGAIVNSGAVVEHDVHIGKFAHISPNSTLGGGAQVGDFAHIALGATVLPLVRVGHRSILGAGSVATRSLPDDVIAFGAPARTQRIAAQKSTKSTRIS